MKKHLALVLMLAGCSVFSDSPQDASEYLVEENGNCYLILPISKSKVSISDTERLILMDVDLRVIKDAEEKITRDVEKYEEKPYLYVDTQQGHVHLGAEIIADVAPPIYEEDGAVTDHTHEFFKERLSTTRVEDLDYALELEYLADDPGVVRDGFVNTSALKLNSVSQALERAKNECTVEWNQTDISYDERARMWAITFSMADVVGDCQTVYLDENGITQLIAYGE